MEIEEVTKNLELIGNLTIHDESNLFNNKTPREIVNESFNNFIYYNNIKYEDVKENLIRQKLLEWNFLKEFEEKYKIEENLNMIPFLNEFYQNGNKTVNNINGVVVKFNCMIQNVFENQLYMGVGFKNNKVIVNQFLEYDDENNNQMMIDNEEDFNNPEENYSGTIFNERLVLNCVVLPGLSQSLYPILKYTKNSYDALKKKKIIVYDYSNNSPKVNEEILIIGVAYEREEELIIHSWKIMNDYITTKIYKDFTNFTNFDYKSSRNIIYNHFMKIFNNDELISEYLILFLISQIYSRVGTHFIGKLNLNLINQNETKNENSNKNDYLRKLEDFIKLITNFTITYTPTIKNLNNNFLYSRFDVNTEELTQGILQTPKHSFFIIDERHMNEGKLEDFGCRNFNAIKNLIDSQFLVYEYPYSQVEINHDTQILIVTEKIKSMFNSLQMIEIPFMNFNNEICENDLDFEPLRLWFYLTRYSEDFTKNFTISNEVSENIQKDFLLKKDNYSADELDNSIKMARLYAVSCGRNKLLYEDYEFVRQLELIRKDRLALLKK